MSFIPASLRSSTGHALFRFGAREADVSDHPLVVAALAYKTTTNDFLNLLARAPGLEQCYDIAGATVAAVPALLDQLVDELDPAAGIDDTIESARGSALYRPRCLESATATGPRTQRLAEVFASSLHEADIVGNRSRIMIIRAGPGNAADRHWYSAECLAEAAQSRLFEGAQSYLDHAAASELGSVRDLAGSLSDVAIGSYLDPDLGTVAALFATFTPTSTPAGATAIALCRDAVSRRDSGVTAPLVGVSINAFGTGAPAIIEGENWSRVDQFTEVLSVDIVSRAGAGGGIVSLLESSRHGARTPFADLAESERIFERTMRTPSQAHALYKPTCQ